MSYYFWAKLGLSAFYVAMFAWVGYGWKYQEWHVNDVIVAGLAIAIVLLITIVADITYHA